MSGPIYRQKEKERELKEKERREREDKLAIVAALDRNTAQQQKNRDDGEQADAPEKLLLNRQILIAKWLNFITAAGTVAALIGLGFLYLTLRDSEKSTDAAKRSADTAYQSMVMGQRAWVFVDDLKDFALKGTVADKEGGMLLSIAWKNTGNTPTKNLHMFIIPRITRGAPLTDFSVPIVSPNDVVLKPQGITYSDPLIPIPHQGVVDLENRKYRLFLWGWAEYDDVFPQTPRHQTDFCIEIIVKKEVGDAYSVNPALCSTHNGYRDIPRVQSQ